MSLELFEDTAWTVLNGHVPAYFGDSKLDDSPPRRCDREVTKQNHLP